MRVLIVNTLYTPYKIGGAELSVQTLAENLVNSNIDIGVLTLAENDNETIINGVKVWRLKLKNEYWPFGYIKNSKIQKFKWHYNDIYNREYKDRVNRILEEFNPEAIHTNNLLGFSVSIWDIAKERNIRIIHTLRDYYLQCPKTNKFKNKKTCLSPCLTCSFFSKRKREISQKVDSVVGISKSILNNHIAEGYFEKAKRAVIYNGFEIMSTNLEKTNFKTISFLNFGFIGQINQAKGVETLLETLKEFVLYKNWKLYMAGNVDPSYKKFLESFLPPERMEFMGYMKQKDFFEKINVLIVPSIWEEPFGRVVLEGLMHRVVVLGSKNGGIKELLPNNEEYTFNTTNGELKLLLNRFIKDPSKLNDYVFDNNFIEKFSIKHTVRSYQEIYQQW